MLSIKNTNITTFKAANCDTIFPTIHATFLKSNNSTIRFPYFKSYSPTIGPTNISPIF
jgi:hypothetical protein